MSTNFNTIIDDLKASYRLASNNILTYFLANLGMLILLVFLIAAVAVPVAIVVVFSLGPNPAYWAAAGAWWTTVGTANPLGIGGLALLFLVPFIAMFLVVIGTLYGVSKQLVATGQTKAEFAFTYFRHKFTSFFGAGLLLTVVIILPVLVMWGSVSFLNGYMITRELSLLLSAVTFVWAFITVGLCANVFPAITYGAGVIEAFKESFDLAIERFDRVFGLLSGVITLFALSFGPVALLGLLTPTLTTMGAFFNPITGVVLAWTVIAAVLWFLVFLPMTIIAFVRVYAEMTGKEIATPAMPAIPIL
ncbi:MAG: hypothetical protein RTU30_06425 [Candidatus Thorarchaeota archaeon]